MPEQWPVPLGAYAEWQAPVALRGAVACLWAGAGRREVLVLPDGCTDLIWEQGTGAYVAGPDTGPAPSRAVGAIAAIRFRPAAGGAVLGVPLNELKDLRVALPDLLPEIARRLPADLPASEASARLMSVVGALVADAEPDHEVLQAAHLLRDPRASLTQASGTTGVSPRQLRRRFHAAVGYGPKTLQRVIRFRRFVSRVDAGEVTDLAALAASTGYADQAHLTRECVELSGLTPAALMRTRHG
jgi:AraC-like DNA-binding protein